MRISCGCCGNVFSGKQDSNYDTGFGLCEICSKEQEQEAEKELDKSIQLVAENLNETNREKFLKMRREVQAYIVSRLFKEKVLTWVIE